MSNPQNPNENPQDNWFDELLSPAEPTTRVHGDENAMDAAGLQSTAALELEAIMREVSQDAQPAVPPEEHGEGPFRDEEYRRAFGEGTELEAMFEAQAPEEEQESEQTEEAPEVMEDPHVKKARPRKKRGYGLLGIPHILATVIWIAIAIFIGVSAGRMLWAAVSDVMAFGRENKQITITIEDGDDLDIISSKLKNSGLIKYPGLFKLYADITGAEDDIAPGTYNLNSIYDYNALVDFMTPHAATRQSVEIMIPEGYTCAQIFSLLEEKGVCTVEELETYAARGEIGDYWFLAGVVRGTRYCLEGYLFPDTYEFYINDEPGRVFGKFLNNFDRRFTDVMKEKIEPLNKRLAKILASRGFGQEYIDSHKIGIRQIVTIASMIEKETAGDAESYTISSVIYNRLTNPGSYPFLNIDATIIYALDGNIDPATGKTKPLTYEDLQLDHPYNSYTNKGLIPGPISNPGRNSLDAALSPEETTYYYYVYYPAKGAHLFASNEWEHENNKAKVRG